MADIIQFEIGCRNCIHLVQTGHKTYTCDDRIHLDDSSVIPIEKGIHTDDWGICEGESYESMNKYSLRMKQKGLP